MSHAFEIPSQHLASLNAWDVAASSLNGGPRAGLLRTDPALSLQPGLVLPPQPCCLIMCVESLSTLSFA